MEGGQRGSGAVAAGANAGFCLAFHVAHAERQHTGIRRSGLEQAARPHSTAAAQRTCFQSPRPLLLPTPTTLCLARLAASGTAAGTASPCSICSRSRSTWGSSRGGKQGRNDDEQAQHFAERIGHSTWNRHKALTAANAFSPIPAAAEDQRADQTQPTTTLPPLRTCSAYSSSLRFVPCLPYLVTPTCNK